MSSQIVLLSLCFAISLINALIDLKTHYLYDALSILSFLLGITLYIINPSQFSIFRLFSVIFIIVLFFIFHKIKILELGDVKYIAGITPSIAFINPDIIYLGTFIFLIIVSIISILKKAFHKNAPYPAALLIFCSFAAGGLFFI
ncbi:MAG: hypothetical protein LBB10_00235 [Bifidobacteriaceae bacterium]|jgi:hypothetical protein|nr:hypothetical protein [Bifidobacteriaceae bacterium]